MLVNTFFSILRLVEKDMLICTWQYSISISSCQWYIRTTILDQIKIHLAWKVHLEQWMKLIFQWGWGKRTHSTLLPLYTTPANEEINLNFLALVSPQIHWILFLIQWNFFNLHLLWQALQLQQNGEWNSISLFFSVLNVLLNHLNLALQETSKHILCLHCLQ